MNVFRDLPFMGVIRVNEAAAKVGYQMGDPAWSNLGQGQPEVGPMAGAPPRLSAITIDPDDHAYGPVEGLMPLREAIAEHYNRLYRVGHASRYTAENVAVSPGGRVGLSRVGAALDSVRLGHVTPDYTAYEDLLTTFDRITTHTITMHAEDGFRLSAKDLDATVAREKLDAFLISNPCNPTGMSVRGDELAAWVEMARRRRCTLLMDEFYSHFIYAPDHPGPVSAAAYVEDVNRDPVVLVDGLTKCYRYPGWRVGWVVAPREVIARMTAAGSFLDGGPSRPIQRAAIEVLEPSRADQETNALRAMFAKKQRKTIDALAAMGIDCPGDPDSTFYVFASLANLPAPLHEGEGFMRAAFEHRVLTVPGAYFDVDPGRTRTGESRLDGFLRVSFGPPMDNLVAGLDRLADMVKGRAPVAVATG